MLLQIYTVGKNSQWNCFGNLTNLFVLAVSYAFIQNSKTKTYQVAFQRQGYKGVLTSLRRSPGTKANISNESFCKFNKEENRFGKNFILEQTSSLQFFRVSLAVGRSYSQFL